jgi:hypothetical protein
MRYDRGVSIWSLAACPVLNPGIDAVAEAMKSQV